MDFSLFYFADEATAGTATGTGRYDLLMAGARYADAHGFSAVWTPERHFHPFGGLYPNPAVTGAAVAAVTDRVAVRAGSVVAPLHHPARIAEEWSVVDNLSGGRAGVALASGWHVRDFALRPEAYEDRKQVLVRTAETVRRLWRGESVTFPDGNGDPVDVRIFPPPLQPDIPLWVTSAGSIDTFRTAGELGAGVLTHLLGQELPELSGKIEAYRAAFAADHPQRAGDANVVVMLHALLGTDRETVRTQIREPFSAYLRSSIGLIAKGAGGLDPDELSPDDIDYIVTRSFDRYFDTAGLFGTVDDAVKLVDQLQRIGVDDIACLIDFGVPHDVVIAGLDYLGEARRATA